MLLDTEFKGEGPAPSGSRSPLVVLVVVVVVVVVVVIVAVIAAVLVVVVVVMVVAVVGGSGRTRQLPSAALLVAVRCCIVGVTDGAHQRRLA